MEGSFFKRRSLKCRLIMYTVFLLITSIAISIWYNSSMLVNKMKDEYREVLKKSAITVNVLLEDEINRLNEANKNIASSLVLSVAMEMNLQSQAQEYMNLSKNKNPEINGMALYDREKVKNTYEWGTILESKKLFEEAIKSGKSISGFCSNESDIFMISIMPIYGAGEKRILGATLLLKSMKESGAIGSIAERTQLSLMLLKKSHPVALFDKDGMVRYKEGFRNRELIFEAKDEKNFAGEKEIVINSERYYAYFSELKEGVNIEGYIVILVEQKGLDKAIAENIINAIILGTMIITVSAVLIIILVSTLLSPIKRAEETINKIKAGDLTKRIKIEHNDEMGRLASYFNMMMNELESMMLVVEISNKKLSSLNEKLDSEVMRKTKEIRNILGNAREGILTFGRDFIIDEEVSFECERIYGEKINGKNILELFGNENSELLEKIFNNIFEREKSGQMDVFVSLLPEKLKINDKTVEVYYRRLLADKEEADKIMVVLHDISEKVAIEYQIKHERNIFNMLVKISAAYTDFSSLIQEYYNFFEEKLDIIFDNEDNIFERMNELLRNIHTFKGDFSLFNMDSSAKNMDELEEEVEKMVQSLKIRYPEDLNEYKRGLKEILKESHKDFIFEDKTVIKKYFGENYISKGKTVVIPEERILYIEEKMLSFLEPSQLAKLLPIIRKLRYRSAKELLGSYSEYTVSLARALEKEILPFEIEGNDIYIDEKKYRPLFKSLIHIYRNIADHGIEMPEERLRRNKDIEGKIKIKVGNGDENLRINIEDDGGGIDTEKIKEKIIREGIVYDIDGAEELSEEDLLSYIFFDNFSTRAVSNMISGRGIGLSAVKNEVEKLGGKISVKSKRGAGTSFLIEVPFNKNYSRMIDADFVLSTFYEKFHEYLENNLQTEIAAEKTGKIAVIELYEYTSSIIIKGSIAGEVILSVDENLAIKLEGLLLSDTGERDMLLDAISEILNIAVGNSATYLYENAGVVMTNFEILYTIYGNENIIASKYPQMEIKGTVGGGKFALAYIERGKY